MHQENKIQAYYFNNNETVFLNEGETCGVEVGQYCRSFLVKVIRVVKGLVLLSVFLIEGDMCGVRVGGTVGLSY